MYVAASYSAVSVALVQEKLKDGKLQQQSVYFASKVLSNSKCNMTEMKKVACTVLMASRKLHHYFETHKIRVPTDRGLNDLFNNPDALARIVKWVTELSGYNIVIESRNSIKSHVLIDFIVDWIWPSSSNHPDVETFWIIHCDGN